MPNPRAHRLPANHSKFPRRLGDGLYPKLLEEGRPLLDDAPVAVSLPVQRVAVDSESTEIIKPWSWRRVVPFVLGAVGVLGVGLLVTLKGERNVGVPVVRPAVPATATAPTPSSPTTVATTVPATRPEPPAAPQVPVPPIRETVTLEPKIAPQAEAPQPSADELLASAKESFERSDLSKALALARRAAEQGAGAPAFVLIASCLSIKQDFAGAQKALKQALFISPGDADAKRMLERLRNGVPDNTP